MNRPIALLVLLGLAASIPAQDPAAAWQKFQAEHRGPWTVEWNTATGTPAAIFGQGVRVLNREVEDIDEARALAKAVLKKYGALLGQGGSTFVETIGAKARRLYVFVYDQHYKGLPVIGGRADLRIHEVGVLSMLGSKAVQIRADFSIEPKLTAKQAWPMAHRLVDQEGLLEKKKAPALGDVQLVIWAATTGPNKAIPTLAWQIQIDNEAIAGTPFAGKVYIDATSGAFLEFKNEVFYCRYGHWHVTKSGKTPVGHSAHERKKLVVDLRKPLSRPLSGPLPKVNLIGTVMAWANLNHTSSKTLTNAPMANMRVTVAGSSGVFYTDSKGKFNIPWSGTTNVNVTVGFRGKHLAGVTSSSTPTTVSQTKSVKPGTNASFQFFSKTAADTAAAHSTVYYMTNDVMTWARGLIVPNPKALDTLSGITARVNFAQSCNAFYESTPNRITFYARSSTCFNTAFGTVVFHEWGHGLDDRFGGISRNDGLSEGWADLIAVYRSNQPGIANGFYQTGASIRTALNTRTYPVTTGSVYDQGEVFMGWAWDFRVNMVKRLGSTLGVLLSDQTVIPSIVANATNMSEAMREIFLVDDNDGNLNNGTPNYADLEKACLKRKVPFPKRKAGGITHIPVGSTPWQLEPRCVAATVALYKPGTISKFELVYKIGSASTMRRAMVPRGPEYMALIPGAMTNKVTYHLELTHSSTEVVRLPETGEFSYEVGKEVFFFDDFEGKDKGWTHAKVKTADDWEIGTPTGKSGKYGTFSWSDPNVAASGKKCWGTDLGLGSSDGRYSTSAECYLRSPVLDLTGRTGVSLRYARWLSVQRVPFDFATVRVNGTSIWGNPNLHMSDSSWTPMSHNIASLADNKKSVQIEWRLKADAFAEFGGWAIDNVEILATKKDPQVLGFVATPEQIPIGKSTTLSLQGVAKTPVVIAWSFTGGPTKITGLPDLSLGLPLQILLFTQLNNNGQWSNPPVTIPSQKFLIGLLVHLQALQDTNGKLALSNPLKLLVSQ